MREREFVMVCVALRCDIFGVEEMNWIGGSVGVVVWWSGRDGVGAGFGVDWVG